MHQIQHYVITVFMPNPEGWRSGSADFIPDFAKITHPVIYDMAQEYAASGVTDHVARVLHPLPAGLRQPLKYTFAHHVTKERPLQLLHVAEELGADREKSLGAVACTDVLWNVGIVFDDVYDQDETNARQQPSAWARFGKTTALAASTAAVSAALAYTARKNGPGQAYAMSRQLQKGVASLVQSRKLPLDAPLTEYYHNYDMRSGFYTVSPVAAIGKYSEASPVQIAGIQSALQRMNRAGQMINDLQDFDESGDRPRSSSFSDIRNGVASVPIRHIWHAIGAKDKEQFLGTHGKSDLDDTDTRFIRRLVIETELARATLGHIEAEYATARDEYIDALDPAPATLAWVDAWLDYKRDQARTVAGALSGDTALAMARLAA